MQGAQCVSRSLGRTGFNQVGNGFGLGEVQFVVEEGALTEFPRPGETATQFQAALEQHIQNNRTAMALQLQHIFACERVRAGEIQGNALVQHLVVFTEKRTVVSKSRLELATTEGLGRNAGQRPGNTHDAYTAATLSGGDGCDGFARNAHKPVSRQK
ncbi:hypothetical protein D3C76_1164320 [compost metagenome]